MLREGPWAHNTQSHTMLHTEMYLTSAAAHTDGRDWCSVVPSLVAASFWSMQMFSNLFLSFVDAVEKFPVSQSPLRVRLPVVMNHSASHYTWVWRQFAFLQTVCTMYKHTSSHRPPSVIFGCHASCWRGKKSFPVQVTAPLLRKTISKLLWLTKAAVIVFDLYTAYGTNHCFLCGQMVANRLYSVSMTTGHSAICIHI